MADSYAPKKISITIIVYLVAVAAVLLLAFTTGVTSPEGIHLFGTAGTDAGIPFAFAIFVLILLGVAFFHHQTLYVALAGAAAITLYTLIFCPGFAWSADQLKHHGPGMWAHFLDEGQHTLLNLGGLLIEEGLYQEGAVEGKVPRRSVVIRVLNHRIQI